MQVRFASRSGQVERPPFTWIAVILEIFTGVLAVPVGWSFIQDPTGQALGIPQGWIEATPFGSYLIPGSICLP